MTDDPLVKIVLTTCNRHGWAEAAIQSVLAQTYERFHLVIVDDASTDGTEELARKYAAQDPERITAIIKAENRGVADSIRVGLEARPHAPYVAFLNDDDLWQPNKLARQLQVFRETSDVRLVYSDADIMDLDGQTTGRRFSDIWAPFETGSFHETLRGNRACASTLIVTADVADRAATTLPQSSIVWDYIVVMLAAGFGSLVRLDERLAVYRLAPTGLSNRLRETWHDTVLAREIVITSDPVLQLRLGGRRASRRTLGLLALDEAVWRLQERRWTDYIWASQRVLRQWSVRPMVWLVIHTAQTLLKPRFSAPTTDKADPGAKS